MRVNDMAAVMTSLVRIIILLVVWEEFAGVAHEFPLRLLPTTITKHARTLSAVWQMLLLSTAITTAVLFSLRIDFD